MNQSQYRDRVTLLLTRRQQMFHDLEENTIEVNQTLEEGGLEMVLIGGRDKRGEYSDRLVCKPISMSFTEVIRELGWVRLEFLELSVGDLSPEHILHLP